MLSLGLQSTTPATLSITFTILAISAFSRMLDEMNVVLRGQSD
jgi:hypothetical protein